MDLETFLHLAVLSLVQGVTEFLPISSSAHLIILPGLFGWRDQGLLIDVAMHIGTLVAVVGYFWDETKRLMMGSVDILLRRASTNRHMALTVLVGTLPVIVAGILLKDVIAGDFRNATLIAATTAIFALVLWVADRTSDEKRHMMSSISIPVAFLIGCAQAIALVPGVSRSGITISAALFFGLARTEAARFSLLLSIPTTAAAGLLASADLTTAQNTELLAEALLGAAMACVTAYLSIAFLMRWLRQFTFTPFVIYRLALAAFLFFYVMA
tara:strand:- start:1139 stop:1948 length:810 start_codon:yes stop_codon:yes gene_type:complete